MKCEADRSKDFFIKSNLYWIVCGAIKRDLNFLDLDTGHYFANNKFPICHAGVI